MLFKEKIKEYCGKLNRKINFIQLGCNDGRMSDPLWEVLHEDDSWNNGLFVDAHGYYLSKAEKNYKSSLPNRNFKFVNAGIVTMDQSDKQFQKFFSINKQFINPTLIQRDPFVWAYGDRLVTLNSPIDLEKNNPLDYLRGVSSFSYDFVLEHIDWLTKKKDISGKMGLEIFSANASNHPMFVETHVVQCVTVNDIYEHSGFDQVDLLQTDLETWDVKIMNDLENFSFKPKFIHFEAPPVLEDDLIDKFKKCGYSVNFTEDTRDQLAELVE